MSTQIKKIKILYCWYDISWFRSQQLSSSNQTTEVPEGVSDARGKEHSDLMKNQLRDTYKVKDKH